MVDLIEIHKSEGLLSPELDKSQTLRDDAYAWTKPVAEAAGTALAIAAGLYLLERGVGAAALLKAKSLSEAAANTGATGEILQGGELSETGAGKLEEAGAGQALKSTWDILEERRLARKDLLPFEEIRAADIETLEATPVRNGSIDEQTFNGVRHSLATDGTFTSVIENDRSIVRHPDGSEHVSHLGDNAGLSTGRTSHGDFLVNGNVTVPAVAVREFEPQVIRHPPIKAEEQLIKPWQTQDGNITVFKDGSLLTQYPFAESALRTSMGTDTAMAQGNVLHQTVLDRTTGTETTYFSSGHALQVSNDGTSKLWTPRAFAKPIPGDYFSAKGNLTRQDWNTGKYESSWDTGHRFTTWKQNGLSMEEFTSGTIGFYGSGNQEFNMVFAADGELVSAGRNEILAARNDSIAGVATNARTLIRSVMPAEDGSKVTGFGNSLTIKESNDGSVQVLRNSAEGVQHIFTAFTDGNIAVNPELKIGEKIGLNAPVTATRSEPGQSPYNTL